MAVLVDIDATDIVSYIQGLAKAPLNVQLAANRVINRVGDQLVEDVIGEVSDETGLEPEVIRRLVSVRRSNPFTMSYRIDASSALIDAPESRPMRGRRRFAQRTSSYFNAGEMVNVVTMEDEKVCPICRDVQRGGPYRIDEARKLIPAHPHCRCLVQPTRPKRGLPVAFRKGRAARTSEEVLDRLRTDLRIEIERSLRESDL